MGWYGGEWVEGPCEDAPCCGCCGDDSPQEWLWGDDYDSEPVWLDDPEDEDNDYWPGIEAKESRENSALGAYLFEA